MAKKNKIDWNDVHGYQEYGIDEYEKIKKKERRKRFEQYEKEDSWVDLSAFEDGYNFGDVSKAILGTGVKTSQNFTKGLQSNLEGLLDLGTNLASMGTEALGFDNTTKKLRNFAQKDFIAENDLVNKAIINTNPFLALMNQGVSAYDNLKDGYDVGDFILKNNQIATVFKDQGTLSKGLDKMASNSVTGTKLDSLTQTVGQIAGQSVLGSTGLPWQLTAFANAAGGEMNNAFQNNANAGQAFLSGLISGASEVLTEYVGSGANKLLGMESLGSKALGKLGNKISNKVVSRLAKMGIDGASEGLEEVLSGVGTAIGQKLTYMSDKEWNELYSKDQALDDFVMGMLGTWVSNVPGQIQSVRRGENAFTGLTENEQTILDSVIEQRTKEAQKDGKELTQKELNQIEDKARKDFQDARLTTKEINEALGDTQVDVDGRDNYIARIINNERSQFELDSNEKKTVKTEQQKELLNSLKGINNSTEVHDLFNTINAIQGVNNTQQYRIATTEGLYQMGILDKNAKGEYTLKGKPYVPRGLNYINGDIYVNADVGSQSGTQAMYHEVFEGFKKTAPQEYENFKKMVREIVGDEAIKQEEAKYAKMYGEELTDEIKDEIINDKFGEIAESEQFINKIAGNRNVFERFIDAIKRVVNYIKGTPEEKQLIKLKNNLESKFSELYKNTDFSESKGETRLSQFDNSTEKRYNTVEEAIETDGRKKPYAKYNTSVDFFNLSYEDMGKVIAQGSKEAELTKIAGEDNGVYSVEINGRYYDAYFNLINQDNDNNEFGITDFVPISEGVENDYDNTAETNSFIETYLGESKGFNNSISESFENRESTEDIAPIYSREQRQQGSIEERQTFEKSNRNKQEVDNTSFSLEQRVSGDRLLDAQDLIQDVKEVGAEVDENGYVTVYHQTTNENAQKIKDSGKMLSKEPYVFFSTSKDAQQSQGRGETKLEFKIPAEDLILDDLFSDNADVKVDLNGKNNLDVSNYLVNNDTKYSLTDNQKENLNKFTENGILMSYVRNPNSNASQYRNLGQDFGQELEPSGEYMNMDTQEGKNKIDGLEYGIIQFKNPLIIDNEDTTSKGWKKELSEKYKGLTGKELSNAIMQDGYDAVMSRDADGNIWEVVNLNGVKQNKANTKYSLTDNQGRQLSKEQQEYFKDSKVRDDEGNLTPVYHMTNSDFTKIDFGKNFQGLFWFASSKEDLQSGDVTATGTRDKANSKIMELYANIKNPAGWREYDNYGIGQLKEMGYDGAILREDDGSFVGFVFNESSQIKNVDNTNPTSNPDIRYSLTVSEANTGKDNKGRELSDGMQSFMADSKLTDENGNLITAYHTTIGTDLAMNKSAFYEFNPVGTPYYRYGNQVVNFFTDSQDMSGSYVDQNYVEADTSKIDDMSQAEDVVDYYNSSGMIDYEIRENNGEYELYDIENDEVLHTFKSQDDLFRNIKNEVIEQSGLDENADARGFQYEGYLNITNPYVVDAKGKYWNEIKVDKLQELKQNLKEKWGKPELQSKVLEGDILKEFNKDLSKLGYQLRNDEYGNLFLYTKEGELAGAYEVSDVMATIGVDLDSDLDTPISTNDVVFQALAENDMGANYDGVIIKNVLDYGGAAMDEETPHNVYVTFAPNQFKAVDNLNPTTDNDIRYSLTEMVDSEDDTITQQQFDYFKNTKAVDDLGELWLVHHGTPAEFNVFDIEKAGQTGLMFGNGFYFTNSSSRAEAFTGDNENGLKSGYINIEKPASRDTKTMTYNEFRALYDALNNNPNMYDEEMGMSNIDALLSDYGDIYNDKEGTLKTFFDSYDNDVNLIDNLSYMDNPTEMYKTLRDVTGYDGIIVDKPSDYDSYEKFFIAFNPDQFKLKTNKTPTNNVDMRLSLTRNSAITPRDVAPVGNRLGNTQKAIQDTIAPLQEQVEKLTKTVEDLRDNIAPLTEEEAQNLPINENIEPPVRYNLTPEESQELDELETLPFDLNDEEQARYDELKAKEENLPEGEDMTPLQGLTETRDIDKVSSPKVNAYQYDHPEVKPYFQEEARILKSELENDVIQGQRWMIEGRDYLHPTEWQGYKRQASEQVGALLDGDILGTKYTKDQLIEGLNAIIEDHGLENKAVSKRLEFMLDDRLRNGYETIEGYQIEPNQNYLNMLREQSWDSYYEEAPIGEPTIERDTDLENLDIDMTPFQDMIDRSRQMEESNTALQSIKNNREQITQDLVSDGLPQDAAEATIQNVLNKYDTQYTPKEQKPIKKGQKMILDAVEKFDNRNAYVDKMAKDYKNEMIKWRGDIANNAFGEARHNIDFAQTDLNGNEIGKAVDKIFEPYKKQGLLAVAEDYLFNRSNIERHKVGKGSTVPLEVSQRLVKEYLAQYPQLKNLTEDIQKYYDNLLQLEVDAGLVDQNQYNFLRGEKGIYRSYVPFYPGDAEKRYFDNQGNLKPVKPLKRAKGGASKIMGIQEAMRKQTMAAWNSMRTNQLYQEIVKTIGGDEGLGAIIRNDPTNLSQNLYTDTDGTKFLTAFVDGREISTKISEELYNELSRNSENKIKQLEETYKPIIKPLQWLSNLRRNLLTSYNPLFALYKNPAKDIQDAALYSKHTARMLANLPTSYIELLRNKSPEAKQFRALYGGAEYKGIGKLYAKVSEAIELAPRFAEFKASRQAGDSVEQAIYNAREVTTNFGRGGYVTKAMNRNGFTFLNASVQGFDKFIRNFSEQPNAKSFAMACGKAALLGIVPAIFNHLAFGTDDDKDEDYEALPNYIKDNYYLFKMGNGEFIRIPKGRALSVMGSAARRTMEAAEGDEEAFKGYLKNAWSQIGPVELGETPLDNTIFAPIVQARGGTKTDDGRTVGRAWHGGDIVPSRLQDKPSNEQYDEKTDKFSIWLANTELGKKLGISPKKLNYVIDQYTGGIGDVFLPMGTEEAATDADSLKDYLLAPVRNELVVDSVNDNKYVSNFYSKRAELTTIANGDDATDEEILQRKYMDDISWEMTALYNERREIQSDTSLSKKEKYERATEIKKEINELAKKGLEGYKNVYADGSYSNVNDDGNYYKNESNEWKKAKDEDVSVTETYGLTDSEKNSYYATKNKISSINAKYKDSDNYAGRRKEIVNEIIGANIPDEVKIELYNKSYKDKNAQYYIDAGISTDNYLKFKSQTFEADKDSNGKSINGTKKQKVFNYIESMKIPFEQKVMLAKKEYPSYNEYNQEIINYLNKNPNIDYKEMKAILKDLGFEVNGNKISW